jgi:phosphoenolpyruvate---glycerone phosphotransferase subunit DhaL
MNTISRDQLLTWLTEYAAVISERADELNRLDGAQGDGDFGASMLRGTQGVLARLDGAKDKDIGTLFKTVAMSLISSMGGTSGPLLGTLFLGMAGQTANKLELTSAEWTSALEAGVTGVMNRGKAQVGDKTMIDAFMPAVEALKASAHLPLMASLMAAAMAARTGAERTAEITATKGRASYVGDRSLGHIDPGALNAWLMLDTLAKVAAQ